MLDSIGDLQVAAVEPADVARVVPAVGVYGFPGRSFVLPVTLHDIGSLRYDLAVGRRKIRWVVVTRQDADDLSIVETLNPDLDAGNDVPHRAVARPVYRVYCEDGSGLRETVSFDDADSCCLEEFSNSTR